MNPRPLALTAAGCAGLLALAGCGGTSAAGPQTAVKAPTDHVLHLSFLQDPGQPPDPDIYYAGQGLLLTTNLYEGLLAYQPGTAKPTIVPALATSWTASKDNRTFTVQLRHGVTFHDGTPFTSAAIKPSFDRRAAVNQGPAYMVADVASVTPNGPYAATITLKESNAAFLDYLAAPYGPKMFSPTALAKDSGSDHAQTWLRTHDIGTGPYTLTDAKVGSHYEMKAYPGWWGTAPYFTDVDLPVLGDTSTQQLQFGKGQLAAIVHDLPASAVKSYLANSAIHSYSLPTLMSDYLYVNPNVGFLTSQPNRTALLKAIDVQAIYQQAYFGRGERAAQTYPPNMVPPDLARQDVPHDPAALQAVVGGLPNAQKTITVGYDSSSTDNQLVANLISAQLDAVGLTVKVQGYPTSQIFGWVGGAKGAPELLATGGWPDAAQPYTWAHINFDPDGGLNYLHCSTPQITRLLAEGLKTGSAQTFGQVGELSLQTGCWLNLVDQQDFVVAQPWLKGVDGAHVVTQPNTLSLALLSVG